MGVKFTLRHQKTDTIFENISNVITGKTSKMLSQKSWKESFWPLRNVSFSLREGESMGIVGGNGAGKSTLLKVIAGIFKPDTGSIKAKGRVQLLQLWAGFHGDLTGTENIYLNGAVMGLKKNEITALLPKIIAFSELERFINTSIKNYSSGMRERLGFAIAVNIRPDILLIDEVLSVGDEKFKEKCRDELKRMGLMDKAVVLVSHSMDEIVKNCDRAICLDQGCVVFEGTSSETVDYYMKSLKGEKSAHP